jgi:hypothetical protein
MYAARPFLLNHRMPMYIARHLPAAAADRPYAIPGWDGTQKIPALADRDDRERVVQRSHEHQISLQELVQCSR